jgi:hypothetical protein
MGLKQHITRWAWVVIWIAHALAAAVWWWLMPGGFPVTSARFFSNAVIPVVFIAAILLALFGALKPVPRVTRAMLPLVPTTWICATLAGWIIFPVSGLRVLPFATILSAIFARGAWAALRTLPAAEPHSAKSRAWISALLGLAIGVTMPWAQRAEPAQTRPLNAAIPDITARSDALPPQVKLGSMTSVFAFGNVRLSHERFTIHIQPMLTFFSTSPDRCWTVFSKQFGPVPRPVSAWQHDDHSVAFQYGGIFPGMLRVSDESGAVRIDALTKLDDDVYSHLNAFSEISISGHSALSLEFSPCPGARIEVVPFDYPVGRPARSAYLDASGNFHVIEASSGEKGPYHDLASGKFTAGAPLILTLYDKERACARLTFEDWASQASFELSPTAGWGVPANAIEFTRESNFPGSACSIFLTLAATSVGRGWDSVGHARGIYRNRIRVEIMKE